MNRLLIRELATAGLLGCAYVLWDRPGELSGLAVQLEAEGRVRCYGKRRSSFAREIVARGCRRRDEVWLATHVNYTSLALAAALGAPRRAGVMLHAAELDENFTAAKRWLLRRMGWVVSVSEFTKNKAVRLGVEPRRIHVVPNAIESGVVPPVTPAPTPVNPMVLFVGRMDERYKGQMDLLDAMSLLHARWPQLRLVFVGSGSSLPDWKAEAYRRQLDACVEFTGRVDDGELARRYAAATVFAMPSENEGFGIVYAEAMARGVPCIGSDRDAAREVIREGKTGFCVPTGNSTALADAIVTLIKSPELRAQMSVAARADYATRFTPASYAERLTGMIRDWQLFARGGDRSGRVDA